MSEVNFIWKLNSWELLCYVMTNPEYLTDSYYRDIGRAIEKRFEELKEIRAA